MGTNGRRRIGKIGQFGFLKGRKGSALSTPQNNKSVLVTTSRQSITIPVTLYKTENGKIAETTALVDSGATICCIDLHFIRRMKWPLRRLERPIKARNADGTSNKGGMIQYQVDLNLRIEHRNSLQRFFMMDLGNKNTVILGHPWLTKMNPLIDWTAGTVKMRGTPVPRHDDPRILEQRYLLRYLHAIEKDNSKLAARIYAQQRNAATLRRVLGKDHPHI